MKRARQINFDTQGGVYVRVPSDLKKNNYKQMKTAEQNKIKFRKMDLDKKYIARKPLTTRICSLNEQILALVRRDF